MATLLEQLDAMLTLKPNWDGYNADPIDPRVVTLAKEFVALLTALQPTGRVGEMHVTPGRDGGVLIEWVDPAFEHELDIKPDGSIGFLHIEKATRVMTERSFEPGRFSVHPGLLKEIRQLVAA
jgi:hypothetical protein